jgi:hypothetical protein
VSWENIVFDFAIIIPMNEETWKRIRDLDQQIAGFKQDIRVSNSEQTAAAVLQSRFTTDHNPCIARLVVNGQSLVVLYYRSDEWIEQPIDLPELNIPAYVGTADQAPQQQYGPGSFSVDVAITNFHLKQVKGYNTKQTVQPKAGHSSQRRRLV